ncbi:hypothetical protein ACQPYK_46230 [Streptosporangium sp. CA-135522]|uniref:hypothetical protein n=1 Tax=Streptosporangium sp. CA-135522 TaxID=3240072 RepID=UPI003D94C335
MAFLVLAPLDKTDILKPEDHNRRSGKLGRGPLRIVDELQFQHRRLAGLVGQASEVGVVVVDMGVFRGLPGAL